MYIKERVTIKEAFLEESENFEVFLTLTFDNGNRKIRPPRIKIGDKDGSNSFWELNLISLFRFTGLFVPSDNKVRGYYMDEIRDVPVKRIEFIDGKLNYVEKEMPSYVNLIGKRIGVVIDSYFGYNYSYLINGYTNERIEYKKGLYLSNPEIIGMPNYSKEKQLFDRIIKFYDRTGRTYNEILLEDKPHEINELIKSGRNIEHPNERILSSEEWDILRKKTLMARLKHAHIKYDESKWK